MRRCVPGVALLACCACSAPAPDPRIAAARAYAKVVSGDDLKVGGLKVAVTDVTSDGRTAHFRGKVRNDYDQPVAGIRYVVSMMPPEGGRVLDTYQRQVDTTLDAGETKRVALDVSNTYQSGGRWSYSISATPVELDSKPFPPPPGWK